MTSLGLWSQAERDLSVEAGCLCESSTVISSHLTGFKNCCCDAITWAAQKVTPDEQRGSLHPLWWLKQQTLWLSALHNVCSDAKTKSFGETKVLKSCMSGNSRRRLSVSKAAQALWSDLLLYDCRPGFSLFLSFTYSIASSSLFKENFSCWHVLCVSLLTCFARHFDALAQH